MPFLSSPTPNANNPSTIPTVSRPTLITFPISRTTYPGSSARPLVAAKNYAMPNTLLVCKLYVYRLCQPGLAAFPRMASLPK